MKFEPSLDVDRPDVCGQLGLFSYDVGDESFETLLEIVVNFDLFSVGDGENLELVSELSSPAKSVVLEVNVVLVNFVLRFDEKENSTGQGVDLEDKSMEEISVDQVVIMPSDDVVASFN